MQNTTSIENQKVLRFRFKFRSHIAATREAKYICASHNLCRVFLTEAMLPTKCCGIAAVRIE